MTLGLAAWMEALGRVVTTGLSSWGGLLRFVGDTFVALFRQLRSLRFRGAQTLDEFYRMGVQSLPVLVVSLAFVALILVWEFSFHMKLVLHQDSLVPAFSTLLLIRELGPVVSCLLLTSRIGAAMAAELGSMKNTDQLDALRSLCVDPVDFLIVPKWMACLAACLCLSVVGIAVALVTAAGIASIEMGYGMGEFYNTMFVFSRLKDGAVCLLKASVFGTILPMVAGFQGMHCGLGSQGVGRAATVTVVQASILIIIADFVVTYLLYAV